MDADEKKAVLDLPLKLVLTQKGSTFFLSRKKQLLKIKLAGDVEEYGISLEQVVPETIQRLLFAEYISKIEISRAEFASLKQELMDLSKLIVFSLLYKQYDDYIFRQIINSSVIKKWNRQNPASILDEKTNINEKFLTDSLKNNESLIQELKKEIIAPFSDFIDKNPALTPDEKNVQILLCEKFLSNLRPFTWFIITKFKNVADFDLILKTLRVTLNEYVEKTKIAEYIALMLLELTISAENVNLRKEAKLLFPEMDDPQEALFDPAIRQRLVAELERKQDLVFVSWKLGSGSATSIGTQGKIQITLYSKNEKSEALRENLNDVKNVDIERNTLIDFYKKLPEGSDESSLGMYYISYLNEACAKANVRFESSANRFADSNLTLLNMSFMF